MSVSVNGTNGITFNDGTTQATVGYVPWRNRIINGDMRIDQRNNGASVTPTNTQYTIDRWQAQASQNSKFSVQRSATAPAGFSNSLLVTSLSAYSVTASDFFAVIQPVEGFNISDFAWGTSSASTATLSFRVYSSLTGTFGGSVICGSGSYPFTYTVAAANTWTTVTVSIPANTAYAPTSTTNGVGIYVSFGLGVGSTYSGTAGAWASGFFESATGAQSVVGTNGATFYITGVQLEAGLTATPFERVEYGEMLRRCQRYYEVTGYRMQVNGNYASSGWQVTKRASPTLTLSGVGAGAISVLSPSPTTSFVLTTYATTSYDALVTGSAEL